VGHHGDAGGTGCEVILQSSGKFQTGHEGLSGSAIRHERVPHLLDLPPPLLQGPDAYPNGPDPRILLGPAKHANDIEHSLPLARQQTLEDREALFLRNLATEV